ncbi:ribosomal protection-like ABC-F family protein [Virgibacillus necropolis]|uniref:ABC transporter ATP-binding protein n=1 Tax=Virgibacillus necropolis TaxID=163877 RepID=A0A221MHU8_9BACI|nr:ABC-F type ribosomal protection protein [Virgibacillus necropolis]ASN07214.1 ABC transporter ATP-binding protein [Virgibacillus necropolis]
MFLFKAKGLQKDWNGETLFENIDLELKKGEHLALFGRNGVGKTTLLNGLLGRISFDTGTVQRFISLDRWGMLEQDPLIDSEITTFEFVQSGDKERIRLKKELEILQQQINDEDAERLERYNTVYGKFLAADGYNLESDVEKCLKEVNLLERTWQTNFSQLSGGEKTRAQLARILMQKPECIIMDEPTNHLDQATIEWLESWMQSYTGAVLYVSHDRYFLDKTAHALYELTSGSSERFVGGYSEYRKQKELEQRTQEALYQKQKQKRAALEQTIRNYQKWFQQAHNAAGQDDFARSKAKKNVSRFKAKEKELERLEKQRVDRPRETNQLNVKLEGSTFSAKRLVHLEKISFGFKDEKPLFINRTMSVCRGDKLAVIGANGTGKSTLLKLITGNLVPDKGEVRLNPQTKIGYFAQELDNLDENKTLLDSMLELPDMTQTEARTILGCFLFSRDDVFKKIKNLSMGEKCRVAFLNLYYSNANLLVLDEPANFLDVATKEVIEEVLWGYPGALIVVSHDRFFVGEIAKRVIQLGDNQWVDYQGSYEEFIEDFSKGKSNNETDVKELELRLTQLMVKEEVKSEDEQSKILEEIREIKQKLADLR